MTLAGDQVTASVSVACPRPRAFDLFTREIDQWWRRGPRYRNSTDARALIHIEPFVGGRVFESSVVDGAEQAFEIGRVTHWEAPLELGFSWRNAVFGEDEITHVEVRFDDHGSSTLVTVTHRGWAAIRADHPARHGLATAEFQRMIGRWWGDQLMALRQRASA